MAELQFPTLTEVDANQRSKRIAARLMCDVETDSPGDEDGEVQLTGNCFDLYTAFAMPS